MNDLIGWLLVLLPLGLWVVQAFLPDGHRFRLDFMFHSGRESLPDDTPPERLDLPSD